MGVISATLKTSVGGEAGPFQSIKNTLESTVLKNKLSHVFEYRYREYVFHLRGK